MTSFASSTKENNNNHGSFGKPKNIIVQPQLNIGEQGDLYEQEADAVADKVMMMPSPGNSDIQMSPSANTPGLQMMKDSNNPEIQMKCEECEDSVQPKLIQCQPEEEEEEEAVQAKSTGVAPSGISPNVAANINSMQGGGKPLPKSTRAFFEPRFGHDFSQVRVHNDTKAVETAQEVRAKAFTTGKDVVFASGQFSPETTGGRRLLAHELTHTIQQNGGINKVQSERIQMIPQNPNDVPFVAETNTGANLRDSASHASNILAVLPANHPVNVTGGRAWISVTTVFNGTSYSGFISHELLTATGPTPVPPLLPGPHPGTVAVTIPTHIKTPTTHATASDRIPPRVDTDVVVTVSGLTIPMRDVILSIDGAGGGNGTVTINGASSVSLSNGTHTLKLRGVNQTGVGNAGNLMLKAHQGGIEIASSQGFSVAAIPEDFSITFNSVINSRGRRGIAVNNFWESDSRNLVDLNEAERSEQVQYGAGAGAFTGYRGRNSGYLAADRAPTIDRHWVPVAHWLRGPGHIEAQQGFIYNCRRAGDTDIPVKNSGYLLTRDTVENPPGSGTLEITTTKAGARTSPNGHTTNAGAGSVSRRLPV